ncbi:MAG: hypothetical protein ABIS36_09720 [Chryseolinea sp.]
MRLRIKSTTLTLQIIGWLQIIGGVTGLGLVAYLMLQTGTINGAILLIFLIGLELFSYSIYSGKRLLTDEEKETGIILSIINQVMQLFQWSILGYGLSYSSGAEITLGVQGLTFKFNFAAIVSTFKMAINSDDGFFMKINLVALLIIFALADILKELKTKNEDPEIEGQQIQTEELRVE